ncbi:37S ribosomal protein S22 [Mortierella hygrophila]|uniref:37S ribosomal protein S22 n=1 Tax=Mortierella hygrophila TaxID=979708 RepID=A0A9P6EWX4_9FUNG|nr:37S ribosomal protein S22 [Mortierella hygrophila]
MTSRLCLGARQQHCTHAHIQRAALGLTTSLTHRLTGLSLTTTTVARSTAVVSPSSTVRGYARVARSRPITPKAPTSGSTSTETTIKAPMSTRDVQDALKALSSSKSDFSPKSKLLGNFKLAKPQPEPNYDPNMVIFLDKQGNVSMIPHDDRVKGQTRDDYNAAATAVEDLDLEGATEGSPHQRGSKEMEYGRKRIGQVELPKDIQDSIRSLLDEYDKPLIRTDALRLFGSLRSTGALEDDTFAELPTKRLRSGVGEMTGKGDKPVTAHILEYGHRESVAYIAAMAPTTFSAIKNVLQEVNKRLPDLNPKTFLDFGTGPGTAIWAANEVWEEPLKYTGVDTSLAMLETAEEILDNLSTNGSPIPNVTFKPFMSHGAKAVKYDVVMSAFALSELTTPALRKSTLEHLWNSTNDMLILVDRGTPSGFRILAEAREQILGLDLDRIVTKPKYDAYGQLIPEEPIIKPEPAHVVAPCPHDKVCPMYESLSRDSQWCHFSQKVQRPDFLRKTKHSKDNYEDAKYTYVVLRKGPRPSFTRASTTPVVTSEATTAAAGSSLPEDITTTDPSVKKKRTKKPPPPPPVTYDNPEDMQAASYDWSRIVVPPLKKDGHVVIDTCAANGYLERIIIPKSQGKIPYRDARKAMWGDLFPHQPKNKAVRKESVKNMLDGDGGAEEEGEGKPAKRRTLNISAEKLMKRDKQKEKKQNRQKVSADEIDGSSKRGKARRRGDDGDFVVDL